MKRYDVTALGELLIDFTQNGVSTIGNPLFEANPGGAPCNVLAMLSRLGHSTAFVGKVGQDYFGQQLGNALREVGIDTSWLQCTRQANTTLALVHKLPNCDRDFSFYRNPGADMLLESAEVPEELLQNSRIFHYGTLSMTHDGVRAATKHAVAIAEAAGAIVSFDPNLRPPLWESMELAREQVLYGLGHCHVLKIADNELQWLTDTDDYDEGISWIQEHYSIPLILLSLGRDGSRAYCNGQVVSEPALLQAGTVDTTGAGDTFMGCVLHTVLNHGLSGWDTATLQQMLRHANAAAALATTRYGALRVMPTAEEIAAVMVLH